MVYGNQVFINNTALKSFGRLGMVAAVEGGKVLVSFDGYNSRWYRALNLLHITGTAPTPINVRKPVKVQRVLLYNVNTGWSKVYRNLELAKRAASYIVAVQQFINIEVEV